jgi:membrane dipeptidase
VIPRGGIFDAHVDTLLVVPSAAALRSGASTQLDLERARSAGVTGLVLAICAEAAKDPRASLERGLRFFEELASEESPVLHLALEGCEPIAAGWMDEETLKRLSIATLTWNGANSLAGGIGSDVGLTPTGRRIAERLYSLGVVIDVSHLCDRARKDVLSTGLPIVATHSNCRSLCDTPRNLPDEDLRQIAATGGVIGITLVPAFIGPDADMSRVADHVEHAASVAGICHVGMGSDFDGVPALPSGIADCTFWPDFFELLSKRGWRSGEIELIAGGNWRKLMSGRRVR